MHVVLCTDGIFPYALGGMQRHSRLLAEHLAHMGSMRLTVLHPHPTPVFDPALGIHEVQVDPIDPARFYLAELWRYSGRVQRELRRLAPDVVFSQGFCVWQGARRLGRRLIVHPHGLEMFQGLTFRERLVGLPFRWVLRHILRRSAVAISLGGRLTPILEDLVLGTRCRVVPIPNAVEASAIAARKPASSAVPSGVAGPQQGSAPGTVTFLFVGRFAANKGLDLLLAVAARLVAEGAHGYIRVQLAGDGPLMPQLRAQGVPDNVDLLGRVDDAELQDLYQRCAVLVLPTRFEGMPTVVLEAMAHGKPIIVSDVGATAELVDATNGRLLPPGDADALYAAIVDLAGLKHHERTTLGEAGRQRVLERFDWPVVALRFKELFIAVNAAPLNETN